MVGDYFYGLVRRIYGLNGRRANRADIIIPLSYGILKNGDLPDAALKTLSCAACLVCAIGGKIAWSSENFFTPQSPHSENKLKRDYLFGRFGKWIHTVIIGPNGASNSITEAEDIVLGLKLAGINSRGLDIVVVCDWPHARSARIIYRQIFPDVDSITIVSVNGSWSSEHPAYWAKGRWRWLVFCLARHAALRILGLDSIRNMRHPLEAR